jgi:hypothetical protein
MTLPLPYSGIGAPLPTEPVARAAELQRRLEGIEGNLQEMAATLDRPTLNRKLGISTSENTSSTTYTTLTTSDRVDNVHVGEDSILVVLYRAVWESSVAGAGRAAIFLNENQLQTATPVDTAPIAQETQTDTGAGGIAQVLGTRAQGMDNYIQPTALAADPVDYTDDVATGQVAGGMGLEWFYRDSANGDGTGTTLVQSRMGGGGPCYIFTSAGTYSISIRYRATSGSVTVRDRRLWTWTIDF